jgi:hypothetical protein
MCIESVESLIPQQAIRVEPVRNIDKRVCAQSARPPLRFSSTLDQTSALQHFDMPRHCGQAHPERGSKLGDCRLSACKSRQDSAPRRVRQCTESYIQAVSNTIN